MKITQSILLEIFKDKKTCIEELLGIDYLNYNDQKFRELEEAIKESKDYIDTSYKDLKYVDIDPELEDKDLEYMQGDVETARDHIDSAIRYVHSVEDMVEDLIHSYDQMKDLVLTLLEEVENPEDYLYKDLSKDEYKKYFRKHKIKDFLKS